MSANATVNVSTFKMAEERGVPTVFLYFYVAILRPVLEYCAPVWHYAITRTQTEQIESISLQKRAIYFSVILDF